MLFSYIKLIIVELRDGGSFGKPSGGPSLSVFVKGFDTSKQEDAVSSYLFFLTLSLAISYQQPSNYLFPFREIVDQRLPPRTFLQMW